ncbi:hypothetical protein ACNKHT_27850 [Shigella flexneri]
MPDQNQRLQTASTVGGVQGLYFVLQRLEGIVALFDGTRVA